MSEDFDRLFTIFESLSHLKTTIPRLSRNCKCFQDYDGNAIKMQCVSRSTPAHDNKLLLVLHISCPKGTDFFKEESNAVHLSFTSSLTNQVS
ncbi:hypothetical protein, partial [uncultured Allobaculum sp.]|uniref:hypothetical protein n=1 Tax=uncultured Allobaculum sp. TaxID=1187017 RepID=UPI00259BB8A4